MNGEQQFPQQQSQQSNIFGVSNQNYVNNPSFMMMRLDTTSLKENIKNFLSSKEIRISQDENGEFIQSAIQVGKPLANEEGIARLMNIIEMRINHQIGQGNFKEDHYWEFIARARKEITETMVKKCESWEIEDANLNMVIDELSAMIEAFITRLIDNKERDSYSQQFRTSESILQNEKRGGLMGFAHGIGGK